MAASAVLSREPHHGMAPRHEHEGFRVLGLGFRVQGFGFRVEGFGGALRFRVWG